jgi:hypothetical protein
MTTPDLPAPETDPTGDPNLAPTYSSSTPGDLSAGASIYRRLERRQRQPQWLMAVLFVLIAAALTAGVIAFERTSVPAAPAPRLARISDPRTLQISSRSPRSAPAESAFASSRRTS